MVFLSRFAARLRQLENDQETSATIPSGQSILPIAPLSERKSTKIGEPVTSPPVPNGFVFSNRSYPRTEISKIRPTCHFTPGLRWVRFTERPTRRTEIPKNRPTCHSKLPNLAQSCTIPPNLLLFSIRPPTVATQQDTFSKKFAPTVTPSPLARSNDVISYRRSPALIGGWNDFSSPSHLATRPQMGSFFPTAPSREQTSPRRTDGQSSD
jgi:hypothetical protein